MGPVNDLLTVAATAIVAILGFTTLLLGVQLLAFFPLTIVYEVWKRRSLRRLSANPFRGRVSVLVPAYNEENTLSACLASILASDYPDLEVIVINDGSTDRTEQSIHTFIETERIKYLRQPNSGKATALNRGAAVATGDAILFTDADSLFLPDTVGQMTRWFADPTVHAVCGNDTPLSAGTILQKVLAVTTHIGTGFVRRALSVLGVLPIITGNLGLIRAETFWEAGGFRQVWGEDLEFTFRMHRQRRRISSTRTPSLERSAQAISLLCGASVFAGCGVISRLRGCIETSSGLTGPRRSLSICRTTTSRRLLFLSSNFFPFLCWFAWLHPGATPSNRGGTYSCIWAFSPS